MAALLVVSAFAYGQSAPIDTTQQRSWNTAALEATLQPGQRSVRAEGDELRLVYRGAADSVSVCCGIALPLHQLEPGLWALSVRIPELNRAVLSLRLVVKRGAQSESLPVGTGVWRGPDAPPPPARTDTLEGKLYSAYVADDALPDHGRALTVYLPPAEFRGQNMLVVYAADGQIVSSLAPVVEPLIMRHVIPPLVLVGVNSAPNLERQREYVPGYEPPRFQAMESFFINNVTAWAQDTLSVSSEPSRRALFGVSNGADFVLALSLDYPGLFGTVFAFSSGTAFCKYFAMGLTTHYYLAAGTLEPAFLTNTKVCADRLRLAGASVHMTTRVGGHDLPLWLADFAQALQLAYGPIGRLPQPKLVPRANPAPHFPNITK